MQQPWKVSAIAASARSLIYWDDYLPVSSIQVRTVVEASCAICMLPLPFGDLHALIYSYGGDSSLDAVTDRHLNLTRTVDSNEPIMDLVHVKNKSESLERKIR